MWRGELDTGDIDIEALMRALGDEPSLGASIQNFDDSGIISHSYRYDDDESDFMHGGHGAQDLADDIADDLAKLRGVVSALVAEQKALVAEQKALRAELVGALERIQMQLALLLEPKAA